MPVYPPSLSAAWLLVIYKLISTRPRDDEDASGLIRRQGDALAADYVVGWLRQFELAFDEIPRWSRPSNDYGASKGVSVGLRVRNLGAKAAVPRGRPSE